MGTISSVNAGAPTNYYQAGGQPLKPILQLPYHCHTTARQLASYQKVYYNYQTTCKKRCKSCDLVVDLWQPHLNIFQHVGKYSNERFVAAIHRCPSRHMNNEQSRDVVYAPCDRLRRAIDHKKCSLPSAPWLSQPETRGFCCKLSGSCDIGLPSCKLLLLVAAGNLLVVTCKFSGSGMSVVIWL